MIKFRDTQPLTLTTMTPPILGTIDRPPLCQIDPFFFKKKKNLHDTGRVRRRRSGGRWLGRRSLTKGDQPSMQGGLGRGDERSRGGGDGRGSDGREQPFRPFKPAGPKSPVTSLEKGERMNLQTTVNSIHPLAPPVNCLHLFRTPQLYFARWIWVTSMKRHFI